MEMLGCKCSVQDIMVEGGILIMAVAMYSSGADVVWSHVKNASNTIFYHSSSRICRGETLDIINILSFISFFLYGSHAAHPHLLTYGVQTRWTKANSEKIFH